MTAPTPEWSAAARAKACQETCPHWREQVAPCLACLTTLAEQAFAAGLSKNNCHACYDQGYAAGQAAERARWEAVVVEVANDPGHFPGERMGARMVGAQVAALRDGPTGG